MPLGRERGSTVAQRQDERVPPRDATTCLSDWVALVEAPFNGSPVTFARIAALDRVHLWYATYRLPSDARFEYRLSPNDPLVPFYDLDKEQFPDRAAFLQLDRLNKRPFPGPPETPWASAAAMPRTPPNPWVEVRPNVPTGTVERHTFTSPTIGNSRYVWVYLPPQVSSEPLGLLVLFDGTAYHSPAVVPVPTILDNLAAEGRAPPLVAVLVDAISADDRLRELHCHQPFLDCLTDELLPWLRRAYLGRITDDPARTIVGGSSAGGQTAAFAALRRPDMFGNVLSLSGGFMWMPGYFDAWRRRWRDPVDDGEYGWLIREYAAAPRRPIRFSLAVGTFEFMAPPGIPSLLEANRHMRDVLRSKGYDVAYAEYNGGHDYFSWRWALPESPASLTKGLR